MPCLILSDLHLGAGDELEDFRCLETAGLRPDPPRRREAIRRLHDRFSTLLRQAMEELREPGERYPHLVLLGDIVDLWLIRQPRERIARALLRVMTAHPGFFEALREWVAAGGRLTWVLGNHDQPLVEARAWALLRDALPGLNASAEGRPVHWFAEPQDGLYAEHGHQWDPFNRLRALDNPRADCVGRRVVRHVVRPLKPVLPLIDAGVSMAALAEYLWHSRLNPGARVLPEVAGHLQRLVGRAAGPARVLWEELRRAAGRPDVRPDFNRVERREELVPGRRIRRLLRGDPRDATGQLPEPFRLLVAGHTHRPGRMSKKSSTGEERTYLNPGAWKPVLHRPGRQHPSVPEDREALGAVQRLTFVIVREGIGEVREVPADKPTS